MVCSGQEQSSMSSQSRQKDLNGHNSSSRNRTVSSLASHLTLAYYTHTLLPPSPPLTHTTQKYLKADKNKGIFATTVQSRCNECGQKTKTCVTCSLEHVRVCGVRKQADKQESFSNSHTSLATYGKRFLDGDILKAALLYPHSTSGWAQACTPLHCQACTHFDT